MHSGCDGPAGRELEGRGLHKPGAQRGRGMTHHMGCTPPSLCSPSGGPRGLWLMHSELF